MSSKAKTAIVLLIIAAAVVALVVKFRGGKAALSSEEKGTWEYFLSRHLSSRAVTPTPAEADAVAAIGDKIVPYIEEQFGEAARVPRTFGKSEYWLVVVLARIGTPRAVEAIVTVLKHDFPGAVGSNREVAAEALVWLGARERAADLEAAIVDHDRRVRESGRPERYGVEVVNLKKYLALLKEGKGKRDTRNFPFGVSVISHAIAMPTSRMARGAPGGSR